MRKSEKPVQVNMLSSGCEVVERYTLCDSSVCPEIICDRRSLMLDERAVRCVIVPY